ncbi:MAG: putative motility protein [Dehalococcoidia bacterium]|nr:putative motility protein [Dehalococcoidia bacterium]
MNMLSALAPASVPVDPLEPATPVQAQVAMAIAAKVLDIQETAGAEVVRLLDPQVGQNLNVKA